MTQTNILAIVEPGPVTHDGRQTWSARCDHCGTRIGGVTRERAETWKHGHDTAARRHVDR